MNGLVFTCEVLNTPTLTSMLFSPHQYRRAALNAIKLQRLFVGQLAFLYLLNYR